MTVCLDLDHKMSLVIAREKYLVKTSPLLLTNVAERFGWTSLSLVTPGLQYLGTCIPTFVSRHWFGAQRKVRSIFWR